jgi:hypothetical protein
VSTHKKKYFIPLFILTLVMFGSDFLSTNLFCQETVNFAVWFVLSIFAFSSGWIIAKTAGWENGGKLIFTAIAATTLVTMFFVTFFDKYFHINGTLAENIILFALRNVALGATGIFGLAIAEVFNLQNELKAIKNKNESDNEKNDEAQKKANLIISRAKLEAEKIIFEAEKKNRELIEKREQAENSLKEFINMEKDLIEKYDRDEI